MELRHLRYFVAIGEEENYRRAAQRLNVAQTALSTQIQDLEAELGFKLFDRLPRGVKLSVAGRLFLEDARRILQQVSEAAARAARVARGQSGTLRVGFTENASWRGVVPESLRRFRERQPDAELQLTPATSLEQIEGLRSGRLDAGFVFNMSKTDSELDHIPVALQHVELAVPRGHPLIKLKKLRLRDLSEASFVWFPRREAPAFYDRLMHECFRGGLKSPRIVQEGLNESTILSLVSHGMGVGWVNGTARGRCPEGVVIMSIVDLDMPLPLALAWRRDNTSPLLANFIAEVRSMADVRALAKKN
jgi:DNA-binding transcriptional LysR family regulator